jgi:carbonic anhydrase
MRWFAVSLASAGLLVGCGDDGDSEPAESSTEPEAAWGYEGSKGPAQWSRLDPAYADCAGSSQSPIDLDRGEAVAPPPIAVAYQPSPVTIENNGHSLQASYAPGSSIVLGGTEYELLQFHFHAPSEHTLGGKSFPIEFHLVHEADDGSIAVLGAFGRVGEPNRLLAELGEPLPRRQGEELYVREGVDALDLLPSNPQSARRWSYQGSLTTPPCSEGVEWTVFDRPIELSERQLSLLTSVYSGTNRPLQPLGARRLLVGR